MRTVSENTLSEKAGAARGDGWFSGPTAWRADHFDDTRWAPCLVATSAFALLIAFAQSGLAGSFDRLLTALGVLGLAFCLRVIVGKALSNRPH